MTVTPAPYSNDPARTIDPEFPHHPRTPAPELTPQAPLCPMCEVEVEHTGDVYECHQCNTVWGSDTGPGEPTEQHPQCPAVCEPDEIGVPTGRRRRYRCILTDGHPAATNSRYDYTGHQGVDTTDPWSVRTGYLFLWYDGDHPDPGPPLHGPARWPDSDRPVHPRTAPLPPTVVTPALTGGHL